jgi:2-polyprenyl-3-methyl-5-hydroxy-6-metoxy-1,4-benzoquinol methylase
MKDENDGFSSWEDAVIWLRAKPGQQALVHDSYYDDPLVAAAERYYQSDEWRSIRRLLGAHKGRALDVGAGRGIASYALAREGFQVTSLEPDTSDLVGTGAIDGLASDTGLPISTVSEVSECLPFDDARFDVVFSRAVLHHMQDMKAGCAELARVLKPGGILLAVREHVISRAEDLPVFLDSHPLHRLYGGENAYMLSQYRDALTSAGLHLVRELDPFESPINYYPQTPESLRQELVARFQVLPGMGSVLNFTLRIRPLFSLALRVAAMVDRRPGRLYSFACTKETWVSH